MGSVAWSSTSGLRRCASILVAILVVVMGVAASPARAQDEPTPAQLLEDFNHYVTIANYELAAANAQALLDRGLTADRFLAMIEEQPGLAMRFDDVYRRAIVVPQLESLAAQLYDLYNSGRKARARSLAEINANIDKLGGTAQERIYARERLLEAGEYATPSLLDVVLRGESIDQRAGAKALLIDLGREAAVPMVAALPHLDPVDQQTVVEILGSIPDRLSIPFLYDLRATTQSEPVRLATEDAIRRLDSTVNLEVSIAGLYRQLAEQYLADRHARSMHAFPGEENQIVWQWVKGVGLHPMPINSAIYNEMMAMQIAERSLELDPTDPVSLAVWLTANFAREQSTPDGYENRLYGPDRREAMYYAVASGAGPLQRMLGRSLEDRETVIARRAIEALARSTGGAGLWAGLGDERPLVDAMSYSDRRVQYDAALALGNANPRQQFTGSERVVPTLAGLVRDAGSRYALVIADGAERQQSLRSVLEGAGYTVLAPADSLSNAGNAIAQAPGIDLIVLQLPTSRTMDSIGEIRRASRLLATPILALVPVGDVTMYRSQLTDDHLTRLVREGVNPDQIAEAARQLAEETGGVPLTEDETEAYATEALGALNTIAISGNETLNIRDAAGALIATLDETDGPIRVQVADVLSKVGAKRAQQALFEAAIEATGDERIVLLVATAESAKRFGNQLDQAQVRRLISLVTDSQGEEATAAAALMGALNLPNDQLVPLIIRGG